MCRSFFQHNLLYKKCCEWKCRQCAQKETPCQDCSDLVLTPALLSHEDRPGGRFRLLLDLSPVIVFRAYENVRSAAPNDVQRFEIRGAQGKVNLVYIHPQWQSLFRRLREMEDLDWGFYAPMQHLAAVDIVKGLVALDGFECREDETGWLTCTSNSSNSSWRCLLHAQEACEQNYDFPPHDNGACKWQFKREYVTGEATKSGSPVERPGRAVIVTSIHSKAELCRKEALLVRRFDCKQGARIEPKSLTPVLWLLDYWEKERRRGCGDVRPFLQRMSRLEVDRRMLRRVLIKLFRTRFGAHEEITASGLVASFLAPW